MKVHNRLTGRPIEASYVLNNEDKDGNLWAIYIARNTHKDVWVPIDGDKVDMGQSFKVTEHFNSKGALCRITRTVEAK